MARIDYLSTVGKPHEYLAGQVIFEVGEPGDALYAVRQGEVNLFFGDHLLETVQPGGFFGEMALIDEQPHCALAVARTDCEVAVVDRRRFIFLIHEAPTFAFQVMQVMSRRMRQMDTLLRQTENGGQARL